MLLQTESKWMKLFVQVIIHSSHLTEKKNKNKLGHLIEIILQIQLLCNLIDLIILSEVKNSDLTKAQLQLNPTATWILAD